MSRILKILFFYTSTLTLLVPYFTSAITIINKDAPLGFRIPGFPVPWNPQFILGPAGSLSATGLVLGIISIFLLIAGFVAVLFVIIGGFRYVTAHGNEEQAEAAKKTLLHAVTGVVIIILSFVIIRVIANALITRTV